MDLIINDKNARLTWGVITTPNTLSTLLAPGPLKGYISNNSNLEDGTRYDPENVKVGERDLNLEIQMIADSPAQFYNRHFEFCEELSKGKIKLQIDELPYHVFRFIYRSCPQYTQFNRGIATLALKLTEPNPKKRSLEDE